MGTGEDNVIDKLLHMVFAVKSVEQDIDMSTFSTSDLVTDLGFDSDLINLFQIEEEFVVTITEEEMSRTACPKSKFDHIIEVKLGGESIK